MSLVIEDVLIRHDPTGQPVPVLFDSPHSGRCYPDDFAFICPLPTLRQAEDTHVEALFDHVPMHGATLLAALFPRTYIDANRAVDDIDPRQLDGPWPQPLRPTEKSASGMGLIRTLCKPGIPLYHGRLPVAAIARRIVRCYQPYHLQVATVIDDLATRFGAVWHINCHSMPSAQGTLAGSKGNSRNGAIDRPDFVLGDRDGTTCERGFRDFLQETLTGFGYRVSINDPYKGVELVRRYADPANGRHSLQLEINRRLYMNEETLERHEGFERLHHDLAELSRNIAAYAAANAQATLRRAAE